MAEHETPGIERRTLLLMGAVAVVVAVAVIGVLGQVADYHKMLDALRRADRPWFALALPGEIAAYLGYIFAYREVAAVDGGPRLSVWTATRVVMVGFGAFIAGSSAGTLGVDYWALHRAGEEPHVAARRVLALNTLEWGMLASLAALAGALSLAGVGAGAPLAFELVWLVVVPICVAAAAWVSSPAREARLAALPRGLPNVSRDPRTWVSWLWCAGRAALADAIGGVVLVRHVVARPRMHVRALLGFVVFWAGDVATLYAALRAFGVHASLLPLLLAYTTAYVVTALPLPVGGAGGVEAGLAFALHAVGIPLAPALLATLVYRVYTLWLPLCVAAAFVPQVPKLAEDLPLAAHAD